MKAALTCIECTGKRSKRSLSGRCRACSMKARIPAPRFCASCEKPINKATKGLKCYRCNLADPEFQARRLAACRKKFEDPAHRAKMAKVVARNNAKARLRPEFSEWLSNHGKMLAALLQTPEMVARTRAAHHKIGPAVSEARVGWCPPEFRDEYRKMVHSKRMHGADARQIIEAKVADIAALKHVDSALDYLRKFAPVQKLEEGFRYGNAILSPREVVSRATVRGWAPERWAA